MNLPTATVTVTGREPLIRRLANFLKLPNIRIVRDRKRSATLDSTICPPTQKEVLQELSRITPIYENVLYLSGAPPVTAENLQNLGITLVVCALTSYEETLLGFTYPENIKVTYIRAGDLETVHLHLWFETAAKAIHDEIINSGKVLVHCAAGVSRSVSLILAYLIKYRSMSLPDAFRFVREKRTIVRPNRGFVQQLLEYEKKCCGKQPTSLTIVIPCTQRKFSL